MRSLRTLVASAVIGCAAVATAQAASITLNPAATSFEADNTNFVHSNPPALVANDGSAADGGFRSLIANSSGPFQQISQQKTGRSKIAVPVHDIGGRDVVFNIPAPDSLIRFFDAKTGSKVKSNNKVQLGDWSVACVWRSQKSAQSYVYLFGKRMVTQFLVRADDDDVEVLEVQTFASPIEGETCTVFTDGQVFFSGEDQPLYAFQAAETTTVPQIRTVSESISVAGLATYRSPAADYLFVAHDEVIDVYDSALVQKGTIDLVGIEDLSIQGGLSILQASTTTFPSGAVALAYEGADDTGVAVGSLQDVLSPLGIQENTKYSPKNKPCTRCETTIPDRCSNSGFGDVRTGCSCFAGFEGCDCSDETCLNNCSGHGRCEGPNVCRCRDGWTGPDCSFVAVKAKYETEANGGDGDDPAIWVHPTTPDQSRIITTTKSSEGEGFGLFDLQGKLLQLLPADEPNNVDIIYNITLGNRTADLAYAACRGDNSLCLIEIDPTGLLKPVSGGRQPLPADYEPYGSCVYRSSKSGKHFLFVNNKEARYLQFELSSSADGALTTQLVRDFPAGSGGQVEGCVADDDAGVIFLGEEPSGVWRYDAEPDGSSEGVQIAKVGDASGLMADVEGITLVTARTGKGGYLIVSSQGISAYKVYQREAPHEYVLTFKVVRDERRGVDGVSNTDGIAVVGRPLGREFPRGLFVTHDDANELVEGGTAAEASFKLVSLEDVLGRERARGLGY
ncbi:Hypothetical protein D9617_10g074770 [Elsinoe fawcettii]|nr:Hypothetical protein D9617_10g074770 [Elsinoe fawcettii]